MDAEELAGHFGRLRRLFTTDPILSMLRPHPGKLDAALADLLRSCPEPVAERLSPDERFRLACRHVIPKVFDDALVQEIRETLTHALLRAETERDAEALALAAACAASEAREDNPLFQMLLTLAVAELARLDERIQQSGLFDNIDRLREALEDPDEFDRLTEDPEILAAMEVAMRDDPAFRREGLRAAKRAERDLFEAVSDGTVHAHLTLEELQPMLPELVELAEASEGKLDDPALRDEATAVAVETFSRFADNPANHPAYVRFTRELRAQADASSGREAIRLRVLADLWQSAWRKEGFLRAALVHASLKRLSSAAVGVADGSGRFS